MRIDPSRLVGTVINGQYRLAAVAGEGSFGIVYAADEMAFGEVIGQVAIKLVRIEDDTGMAALLREVRAMAQLSHANLIGYRSAGEVRGGPAGGCFYLSTELGSGTLADRLARPEKMTADEVMSVASDIAGALVYLHGRQAIHRDVKPANILRVGDGWKLGDFGLVRGFAGTSVTATARRGTVLYMSPEAYLGTTGPFVDNWALGAVLQECLTGQYPYPGSCDVEVIAAALSRDPDVADGLPEPLGEIIRGCLTRDRGRRLAAGNVLELLATPRGQGGVPPPAGAPGTVVTERVLAVPAVSGSRVPQRKPTVVQVLYGHKGRVTSVAFSPDGHHVITGSTDHAARLWDASTGRLLGSLIGHTSDVKAVAFSPDGALVLTGSADSSARLWDVATLQTRRTLSGHNATVNAVAFLPDGETAVTGGSDRCVTVWEVGSGRIRRVIRAHMGSVSAMAVTSDGRFLVTGSSDRTVMMWDLDGGTEVRSFGALAGWVESVAVSACRTFLAIGIWTGSARLVDMNSGRVNHVLRAHSRAVSSVAISPDGHLALTGGYDGHAYLWDVRTGGRIGSMDSHEGAVHAVAFSPDGRLALTGSWDETARIWSLEGL